MPAASSSAVYSVITTDKLPAAPLSNAAGWALLPPRLCNCGVGGCGSSSIDARFPLSLCTIRLLPVRVVGLLLTTVASAVQASGAAARLVRGPPA